MSKAFQRIALSSLALSLTMPAFASISAGDMEEKTRAEIPPPTIDSDGDGKMDAWDRDANGVADAWDTNADGKPDKMDNNGDGKPDAPAPAEKEPRGKSE
jgi:hypothetical protein